MRSNREYDYFGDVLEYDYFPSYSSTSTQKVRVLEYEYDYSISDGHRHRTPAIARCFTFYTMVSPLRRKYMEEHREQVIRLSSDSSSFLQNCKSRLFRRALM